MSLVIRSVAGEPFSESAVGRDGVPRGGVGPSHLHKRCHSIIFAGRLAGVRGWVGQAGGCAARRQGMGEKGSAPAGALGERRWGAFSESAKDGADREDSFPTGRWLPGQGRRSQHGFLNRVDEGVDAAVCPRQFQKS